MEDGQSSITWPTEDVTVNVVQFVTCIEELEIKIENFDVSEITIIANIFDFKTFLSSYNSKAKSSMYCVRVQLLDPSFIDQTCMTFEGLSDNFGCIFFNTKS